MTNYNDLFNPNIMKPDMKLRRVNICLNPDTGRIQGIGFTLRTIGSPLVISRELQTLGSLLETDQCKSFPIEDDDEVVFIEITYSDAIDTFILKLRSEYISAWGNKRLDLDSSEIQTRRWIFRGSWQPIGLQGTADENGVYSFSPISYSMSCGEQFLEVQIVPNEPDYNNKPEN